MGKRAARRLLPWLGAMALVAACGSRFDAAFTEPQPEPSGSEAGAADGASDETVDASDAASDGASDGASNDASPLPWDAGPPPSCQIADGGAGLSGTTPVALGGTRIRPTYVVLDDGTRLLFELRDLAAGGAACILRKSATGVVVRCFPRDASSATQYYSDATCTTKLDVLVARSDCPAPLGYASVAGGYAAIGAPVPSQPLYRKNGLVGECPAVALGPEAELRALGPVTTEAGFVAFHEEREPMLPGLLDAVVNVGDDGSRIWFGAMHDVEHDVRSEMFTRYGTSDDTRVVPVARAGRIDGCCSLVPPAPCPRITEGLECNAPVIRTSDGAAFVTDPFTLGVFPLGPAITTTYCGTPTMSGVNCPVTVATKTGTWSVGPAMPAGCFVSTKRVTIGSGRLTSTVFRGAGISFAKVVDGRFPAGQPVILDTQATTPDKTCRPLDLGDGQLRCVPGGVTEVPYYADPDCTQMAAPAGFAYVRRWKPCGHYEVFPAGAPIAGGAAVPTYTLSSTCRKNFVDQSLRAVGPAADPTSFPALPLVTD